MKIHLSKDKGLIKISSADVSVGIVNSISRENDKMDSEALFLSDICFRANVAMPDYASLFLSKSQEILLKLIAMSKREDLAGNGVSYLKSGKLLRLSNMRLFPVSAGGASSLEPNFVIEAAGEKLFYAGASQGSLGDVPDDCANILFNGEVFYPDFRYLFRSRLQDLLNGSANIVLLPVNNMNPLLLTAAIEAAENSSRILVVDLLTYLFIGLLNKHSLQDKYKLPGNIRIKFDKQHIDVLESYGYAPFIQSCGKMKIDQYAVKRKRSSILLLLSDILPFYDVLKEKNIGSIRGAVCAKLKGIDNHLEPILAEKGVVSSEINIKISELSSRTLSVLSGRKVFTTSSAMGDFLEGASNDADIVTLGPGTTITI